MDISRLMSLSPLDLYNHILLTHLFCPYKIEEIKRNLTQVDLHKFLQQKHTLVLAFSFEKWCSDLVIQINHIKK